MPTTIAATTKITICVVGKTKSMKSTRAIRSAASTTPSTMPIAAPISAVIDALVPDHPPDLTAGHPDRPQHPDLARPLEDGEHERVDDPEEADDTESASST